MINNIVRHDVLDLGTCGFIEDFLSARYVIQEIDQKLSIGPEAYIDIILDQEATKGFVSDVRALRARVKNFRMSYRVTSINCGDWFFTSVSGDLQDIKALEPAAQRAGAKLVSQ